jgi:virulence-associated protein VagC
MSGMYDRQEMLDRLEEEGKAMDTARLMRSGNIQVVQLPEKYAMPGERMRIFRRGRQIILEPYEALWELFFQAIEEFPDDFMKEGRQQPEAREREPF